MTPEDFLQQKQEAVTPLALVMMMSQKQELMKIMLRTSLLLRDPGTLGQLKIKAHFFIDQEFSSFLFSIFS